VAVARTRSATRAAPATVKDEALVAQKRAAIVAACVPLFHRQGYHATTTRQIAAAAGMTMGGLYLYIREKSDCLRLILESIHEDALALADVDPALPADEALVETIVALVRGMHRHRKEILVLDRARDVLLATNPATAFGYEQQVVERIETLLRRGIDEGRVRPDLDVPFTALAIFWQCSLWIYRYERLRQTIDVDTFARRQAELLLAGVRVRSTPSPAEFRGRPTPSLDAPCRAAASPMSEARSKADGDTGK
jgi:AcrR family transcriptional regulator